MDRHDILKDIRHELHELVELVFKFFRDTDTAQSATLSISTAQGQTMPATLTVGQTAVAKLHEFAGVGGTGVELNPIGPVTYSSSDATIATVDPVSGMITAIAPGTATISGSDAGNSLSASDTASVIAAVPKAVSATLVITPNAVAGRLGLPGQPAC
jgi:hypothetical protein